MKSIKLKTNWIDIKFLQLIDPSPQLHSPVIPSSSSSQLHNLVDLVTHDVMLGLERSALDAREITWVASQ
jgi:hypothetical protein